MKSSVLRGSHEFFKCWRSHKETEEVKEQITSIRAENLVHEYLFSRENTDFKL